LDAQNRPECTLTILAAKLGPIVIAKIKFGKVAVKVFFRAMLVNALHAKLEDAEIAFNRVRMDSERLATR